MAKDGFYVRLGNGKSVCQHVYVRNMAYAHILAAKAFTEKNRSIEGEVYFITDGPAHNFFKFYDQVVVGAGYKIWPSNLWLPFWLAFAIGGLIEFGAWLISPIKKVNPKFSRFAAVYTCSNFTFNSNKAKEDFGYIPKYATTDALSRTIEHYRKNRK
jgi:nucleoside-diphosphate-sugar epimerase